MTDGEALRIVAMLTSYFRQELSDQTAALWAQEIRHYEVEDALEATEILGTHLRFMPSLADFSATIADCRNTRLKNDERLELVDIDTTQYCSFAEFLRDFPEWRERVLALGERQSREDRRRYGQHPVVAGLAHLIETDTWRSEDVFGHPTKAKAAADAADA